jgi:hypothetical protein
MESKASALEVILSKQLESKPDGVQSFSFGGQFIQTIGIQTRWSPKLQLWRSIYPNNWNPNQMASKASALEVNLSKQLESKPDGVQSFSFGGQFIQTIGIQTWVLHSSKKA